MEIAGESLEVQDPPQVVSRAPGIAVSSEELLRRHEVGGGRLAASNARSAAAVPALRTVVVTCMDTRIDVQALFGLGLGEVHTLRNAGGVVTDDVVRSVVVSQRKLGTREVLVVAHSRCGMATFSDDDFSEELAAEVGMRPLWRTYAFADPAADVRRGVERLRRDPFLLPETVVRGFVLDIESFALTEVGGDEPAGLAGVRDSG
jgi:carbonic anhydrase